MSASRTRPKGYASWSPRAATETILEQVEEIIDIYRSMLPLTLRQIFYILVGNYGYPKDESAYARLCEYLIRARRAKMIDFDVIRDDGISVLAHAHYDGEEGFHAETNRRARNFLQNKLQNQGVDIRVFCEASGMLPQLANVLRDYSVPAYSCSGFDSLTAKREVAGWVHDTVVYEGKEAILLHLGDCDPSGASIFDSFRADVAAFLREDLPAGRLQDAYEMERIALTRTQIREYDLPTSPPKKSDGRSASWEGGTCQLEALPPDELARIVCEEVEARLDLDQLEADREGEVTARRNLVALPSASTSESSGRAS